MSVAYKDDLFQALRYKDDGKICIVQGPVLDERNVEEEEIFEVDTADIIPCQGTPAVCHSLQKATHLNGKIGDRRAFDEETDRYEVHFEGKSLKPVKVKTDNVRIVFDLP